MGLFPLLPMLSLVSAGSRGARLGGGAGTVFGFGDIVVLGIVVLRLRATPQWTACLCGVPVRWVSVACHSVSWSVGRGRSEAVSWGCGSPCLSRVDRGGRGETAEVFGRSLRSGSVAWIVGVDRWVDRWGGSVAWIVGWMAALLLSAGSLGRVAELADAQASGACGGNLVRVQVPPRPLLASSSFVRSACCGRPFPFP